MAAFDRHAASYDARFRGLRFRIEDRRYAQLLRPWCDGRAVLDLGAGTGAVARLTRPRSYEAIDASAGMIDRLVRALDGTSFASVVHAPITAEQAASNGAVQLEWQPEAVTAMWSLPYFEDVGLVLRWLARVAAPAAVCCLQWWQARYKASCPVPWRAWEQDELDAELLHAGWSPISCQRPWPGAPHALTVAARA